MALSKTTRWAAYAIGFIATLYLLQWLLEITFNGFHSDAIVTALRPLHNHYFSFSKYYITTEGALSEFTDDTTGVGRMIVPLVIGGIIWFVLAAVVGFIKALEKYSNAIILGITIAILVASVYTSFFAPPRKTTFTENEIIIEKSNSILGYQYPSSTKAHLKFSAIDKIEFDFLKAKDLYFDAFFLQIFIVVEGKRYLIGENQVDSNNSTYIPSDIQKQEAQKLVDILSKLIGK